MSQNRPKSAPAASPPGARYALVAGRFNEEFVEKLVAGAAAGFAQVGLSAADYELLWVPGSFELPLTAKRLAQTHRYAAIVCLGVVIQGDTQHFEYVCQAAAEGILWAGLETGVPCIFGVLTCANEEQVRARTGGVLGNKGTDAALAAVEMASLFARLGGLAGRTES